MGTRIRILIMLIALLAATSLLTSGCFSSSSSSGSSNDSGESTDDGDDDDDNDGGDDEDGGDDDDGGDEGSACVEGGSYAVGDVGPGGGLIFFVDDDETYSHFTYLEAAPEDIVDETDSGEDPLHQWASGFGDAFDIGAHHEGIGHGRGNTEQIVAALDEDEQTNRAAQRAWDHEAGGCDDWFLPSLNELKLMYSVLHDEDLGDFDTSEYWTSSETGSGHAWGHNFHGNYETSWQKTFRHRVRPARKF